MIQLSLLEDVVDGGFRIRYRTPHDRKHTFYAATDLALDRLDHAEAAAAKKRRDSIVAKLRLARQPRSAAYPRPRPMDGRALLAADSESSDAKSAHVVRYFYVSAGGERVFIETAPMHRTSAEAALAGYRGYFDRSDVWADTILASKREDEVRGYRRVVLPSQMVAQEETTEVQERIAA